MRKCKLCSPTSCRDSYLYVVHDSMRDAVKIGCSVNVSNRMQSYRANGTTWITLVHKRRAGCEWTAPDRETAAIARLGKSLDPLQGDWFKCTEGALTDAVTAVEWVCRQVAGTRR